jgi:hypothetical protein
VIFFIEYLLNKSMTQERKTSLDAELIAAHIDNVITVDNLHVATDACKEQR